MPFISQVAVGGHEKVKVYGNDYNTKDRKDGTGVRDYIHVIDLAQGHVAALNKLEQGCGYKVYNMGTGRGSSVLEVIKAFEEAPRKPGDTDAFYSNSILAENELAGKVSTNGFG